MKGHLGMPSACALSLRATYPVLTSQLCVTEVGAFALPAILQGEERQGVRRGKESAWGKVPGKPRMGGHSHFCSMTPSVVLVLHKEAYRVEKEAVVRTSQALNGQSVTVIGGMGRGFRRARGNASSLSGVPLAPWKLDIVSSTIKLTINRDYTQQTKPFWPEPGQRCSE